MLVQEKIGNISSFEINGRHVDRLSLEWYEARKRIWRKLTKGGKEIAFKFLRADPELADGDILFADEQTVIAIEIVSCNSIVIQPKNMYEMASVCYEIGNKHLPLFYEEEHLLIPFDAPLYKLLGAQGYDLKQERRKLVRSLKTTVAPHSDGSSSLFSKIMKMSGTNSDRKITAK